MAIIQISKIQHRTGADTDLPQLDEGEFGFSTDERRLYIGNDANLYPPAGLNLTTQTEILTQYSNINFSQIEGSLNSNLDLTNIEDGQVLAIKIVGDTSTVVNRGGSTGSGNINLGNISNVRLLGGVNGYFLQTDGTGNIAWVSKDVLRTPIIALSNATPVVMTISNATPYVNKIKVTITGVLGANANTIVNGQDFYVKMSNDYPTSGNVTLYTDNTLTTPLNGTNLTATANTGISTALLSDTAGLPAGANTQLQFNNNGVFGASANLTFSTISNTLSTAYITGTLTALASSQPNITSVGTLVDANIAGTVTATKFTSNVATGTPPLTVSSTTRVDNLNADLLDGYHGETTNIVNTLVIRDSNGSFAANIITANLAGNATTAGTVVTAAQPNITSVGTLTSVTVTGNVTSGNVITGGRVSATGNVSGGNLTTGGIVAATGNVSGGNLVTTGVSNVGNLNVVTSVTSNLVPSANITYNLGNTTNRWKDLYLSGTTIYIGAQTITTDANGVVFSNTATMGNLIVTANVTSGNLNGGNLITSNYLQGVLTTAGQPNITSVGSLVSLNVVGNIITGNANLGNAAVSNYFIGDGSLLTNLSYPTPTVNAINLTGNTLAGNVINSSLTKVGTLGNLTVTGNIISGNVNATSGTGTFNSVVANSLTLNNSLNLLNLNATGNVIATANVIGNLVTANSEVRIGDVPADNWGRMRLMQSTSGYGFTFGTPALVITNEELNLNEAIVLGDSDNSSTLFGISSYSGGNGTPTTGNEVGWSPKLTLTGTGNLTVNNISTTSIALTNPLEVGQGGTGVNTATGTGSVVRATSPGLNGIPLAPTASVGTNTNQIATTAFVTTAIAANPSSGLGIDQTWQNFTSSRALNTNYTNTTMKPISVSARLTTGGTITGIVGGVEVAMVAAPDSSHIINVSFIVPPSAVYRVNSTKTLGMWVELR